jgi:hypothetical protein
MRRGKPSQVDPGKKFGFERLFLKKLVEAFPSA